MPIISKILVQAALPYVFWGLLAGLKIWAPRVEKKSRQKELKVLKSLVDYQAINENNESSPIEFPISKDELAVLQSI